MKRNKLFLLAAIAIVFAWAGSSFAQTWTLCPGSISLTGMGVSPSINTPSPNIIWVAGGTANSPKVMRSTDGGTTFTNVTGNMTATPEMWTVWAIDANTAFVGDGGAASGAGGNAKVWKTTNGGTSWTTILTTGGTVGFINSIIFSRTMTNVGFVQSDPPTGAGGTYWVQKTTDGGTTWTLVSPTGVSGQASAQGGFACVDDQEWGFGLGNNAPARVRWTSNGGTTWNLASVTIGGGFVSGYTINSSKTIQLIATGDATGGSLPSYSRSTDNGTTWTTSSVGAGFTGYATFKWVYGTNVVYLTGGANTSGGVAKKSTDGGATWVTQNTSGVVGITYMDLTYNSGTGTVTAYAIAADGSCIKNVENVLGIDPNNTTVPTAYKLEQNYPNPFNPTTNIKYSLPKSSQVTLKIYDLVGHEVMTVVNAYQTVGNYVETIDASGLASGVYFYTLRAGDYAETKKFSLVK